MSVVRVLVVEDEEIAAEAHAAYVGRVAGFDLAGVARSAGEAMRLLDSRPGEVDLVLLDMHLPDGHGLGLLQRIRAAGHLCDVIAVTSARDSDVVRRAGGEAEHWRDVGTVALRGRRAPTAIYEPVTAEHAMA